MKIYIYFLSLILLTFNLSAMPPLGHGSSGIQTATQMMNQFMNMFNNKTNSDTLFDTWDNEEDNTIYTKIVSKEFTLLKDTTNNKLKDKGGDIYISIVSENSSLNNSFSLSPSDYEDAASLNFNTTAVSRDAKVKFKMCANYNKPNFGSIMSGMMSGKMNMDELWNSLVSNAKINIYPLSDCSSNAADECSFSNNKKIVECFATDHFALRPEKFNIESIKYVKSALKTTYNVSASSPSNNYDITSTDDYKLNLLTTKYMPNNDINNSLNGEATIEYNNFVDGVSNKLKIDFNDTAKVELQIRDISWSDIDKDDTNADCSNSGRFICGETNSTFIPSHFHIEDANLSNHNNSSFTYIANNTIAATISLKIEVQNSKNENLQNFDENSWENSVNISFKSPKEDDINKTIITNSRVTFKSGLKDINLTFNYKRDINNSINPFKINGSDINISISSLYEDNNITQNNGENIVSDNAIFIYGRTNALRTRAKSNLVNVPLYYEAYCYNNSDSDCNKALLPNGTSSLSNDDPRWFKNSKHSDSSFGTYGDVSQKIGSKVESDEKENFVKLNYKGSTYPYKTTMINEASSWLIYNKYNINTTYNEFEVEFEKGEGKWAGKKSTDTVSKNSAAPMTNRRTMW